MTAYLVLLLAALSRFFPHALGGVGLNVTAVGGGLLFFGARRPRREAFIAAAVFAATDWLLTVLVFAYPFHLRDYVVTWLWYLAIPLLGRTLMGGQPHRAPAWIRGAAAVLGSAASFFLLSNVVVWARGGLYPHTAAGLNACYAAGLPFFGNDLASTSLATAVFFGLPALARELERLLLGPAALPPGR